MKHKITNDTIKAELKKIFIHDIIKYSLLFVLCVSYFTLYFLNPQSNLYNQRIIFLLMIPLIIYFMVLSIIYFLKAIKGYNLVKNNNFDIITDVLVDKTKKASLSRYKGYHYTYTFIFEKTGVFKIEKKIFDVSNPYVMNNEKFYESSEVYDEFYVVSVARKNMLAYNSKYFEVLR